VERHNMLLPVMSHISKTLEGLYKRYWLAGGTLLGWYRDCGIIPHTQV
jgi:phosphorylcholine metabolism protein LicD